MPNWWVPISSRSTPAASGSSDTAPNDSMVDGSRNTSAPMGGPPPHATVFTARMSASISLTSTNRYGAAAEWSTTTVPPFSCSSLVTGRRSVTAPMAEDADVMATSLVGLSMSDSH